MIDFAQRQSTDPVTPATRDTPVAPAAPTPAPFADVERLGDEIAELAAHIDAATYRLLVLIREFDQREGWGVGFKTCAHWLSWRTGIAIGPAREKVRVARALEHLPLLSEKMRSAEEGGGREEGRGGGTSLRFHWPDGWLFPDVPPASKLPHDPIAALEAEHGKLGIRIDPETSMSLWGGEPFDVGYAIHALRHG